MGRKQGNGIEVHSGSLRVNFMWEGKRYKKSLALADTPPNRKFAERKVGEIRAAIDRGSFRMQDFFRGETTADHKVAGGGTLLEYGDLWLKGRGHLAPATLSQYANSIKFWCSELDGARPLATFRASEIEAFVGAYDWAGPKLRNNYLITLRGMFELGKRDGAIDRNPVEALENVSVHVEGADPLLPKEAERVLEDMRSHYDAQIAAYFEFALFTGLRPEEQIALLWSDVDFNRRTVMVRRARSFRGNEKSTKTGKVREVELLDRALAVLKAQRPRTQLKEHGHIFENPRLHKPWHDERSQRDHYWAPTLRRLGLRERRAYCTRHTFASMMITEGAKEAWLAKQLGHSTAMLWKHYAKWMGEADSSRERIKMDAALKQRAAA